MPEAIQSKVLAAPRFRYSQLVRTGPNYYVSGMVALDNHSGELVSGGAGVEAKQILRNLGLLLDELEMSLQNVVLVRIYTREFESFPDINAAWEEVFDGSFPPPARTSLGVSMLPLGASVEMEFMLYRE